MRLPSFERAILLYTITLGLYPILRFFFMLHADSFSVRLTLPVISQPPSIEQSLSSPSLQGDPCKVGPSAFL